MARKNALIRFYFGKNAEKLSDSLWAKYWNEIDWVLTYTGQLTKNG